MHITTLPEVCPPCKWQSQIYFQHYFRTLCLLMMVSTVQAHLSSVTLGLLDARVKLQFVIDRAWVRAAANNRVCSACLASRRSKWILWSLGPMADSQSCPQKMNCHQALLLKAMFSHTHSKWTFPSLWPEVGVQLHPLGVTPCPQDGRGVLERNLLADV